MRIKVEVSDFDPKIEGLQLNETDEQTRAAGSVLLDREVREIVFALKRIIAVLEEAAHNR